MLGKEQPNFLARSLTECRVRFRAAAARNEDAPLATSDRIISSFSAVQKGFLRFGIAINASANRQFLSAATARSPTPEATEIQIAAKVPHCAP
jgi:hypothetical protein